MKYFLSFMLWMGFCAEGLSWGFLGHRTINERACYAVPAPLLQFYKSHANFLVLHATDPDSRRSIIPTEACRHFIDCDQYEFVAPLDSIIRHWGEITCRLGEDSVLKHGIVPWQCARMFYSLKKAFEERNTSQILKLSADIGHYIADACVPLHTTSNYNGQKTGQHGIHALWESRIPELLLDSMRLIVPPAQFWTAVPDSFWQIVEESYGFVPWVLNCERLTKLKLPQDQWLAFYETKSGLIKKESPALINTYHNFLGPMVEQRMRRAIQAVSSCWYTAWILAGEPDLNRPIALSQNDESNSTIDSLLAKIIPQEDHGH